ncbi:hypothetical protein [uncultured Brachyspira sp.]|uniref:hypothetical protein n=1 Tax=uncultured Brachyspira sp. TaxID=221953 RepID=UPI002628D650|nr:hypothetical protein [uncultured Brachyspira sp.]
MNKKILSIFVMVMALSLLGVSCNKKTTDPTNDGGSTATTTLTVSQINEKIKALSTVKLDANGVNADASNNAISFDFASVAGETTTFDIQGVAVTTAASVSAQSLLTYLQQNLTGLSVTAKDDNVPSGSEEDLVVEVKSGNNTVTLNIKTVASTNWL